MNDAARLAARAEELMLDTRLGHVRAHCERTGQRAIGHLPVYAPRELIDAAGMLPVAVFGGGDQIDIIRGDAYFQSYICQIPRSVIEMGLSGCFDVLSGMLFPATCDVIRNLSGMWQMLFPDKFVAYVDVPHNHADEIGGKFYEHELRRLAEGLGRVSGQPVTDDSLRETIQSHNANRRAIRDLYDARERVPHLVPTSEVYAMIRAGCQMPVEEHTAFLQQYLQAALATARPELDHARVVVVGAFCEQPPLGMIKTLERAGCYIVDDDFALGMRFVTQDVPVDDAPFRALAMSYVRTATRTASRYEPEERKGQWLVDKVRARHAEGVVFCAPSFCDPALLEQPMLQAALDRVGIAQTSFKYSENTAQFQPIHEQAGTFSDSIKLWSEA